MFFDSVTIMVCAVLLVLAVWSSLSDTLFRKIPANGIGNGDKGEACKPVSVVIVADNNANELKSNLPLFLEQDYSAGFEVIVVVDRDEDGSSGVLSSFAGRTNLYTTFVPATSRYMSRRKLAITLGVKAAKNEWVLLTDATCRPLSGNWISGMAALCSDGVNMVLGYSNYSHGSGWFKVFDRFHREYSLLREAVVGTAYGMAGCNLMFRKSMFMAGNGFQGNLKYLRGEYDFLVNKYAVNGGVAVSLNPDSYLEDSLPYVKAWRNKSVFYVETRRHLARSFKRRFMFCIDMLSLHFSMVCGIAVAVLSVVYSWWMVLPFACVALFVPFVFRTLNAKRAMKKFGLDMSWWKVVPFELRIIWHNLRSAISYRLADKYDFISHKS